MFRCSARDDRAAFIAALRADVDDMVRALDHIEIMLDVIKTADYIIDMGPEGGDRGGTVIAKGTPEEVAKVKKSYTGQYVKKYLETE